MQSAKTDRTAKVEETTTTSRLILPFLDSWEFDQLSPGQRKCPDRIGNVEMNSQRPFAGIASLCLFGLGLIFAQHYYHVNLKPFALVMGTGQDVYIPLKTTDSKQQGHKTFIFL